MTIRTHSMLLAGAMALLGSSLPANAIEADAAAKALAAAIVSGSNVEATYDSAAFEGSDVVIKGFAIARKSEEETITFGDLVIVSPTEGDNGVFQSPEIRFSGATITGKATGSMAAGVMTDVTVLEPPAKPGGLGESILFRTADATDLRMQRSDQPGEITAARIHLESGNPVGNVAQDSKGVIEAVTLPPEAFPPGGFQPQVFGYEKLVFDVSWDGSRDLAARTVTIRDFTLGIHEGGELSVSGLIGEVPDPRVLDNSGAATDVAKTQVHNLTIRYDDASLAGRILDFLAGQQGLTRDDYVKQISAALPFLLIALNNPAFQNEVAAALTGFLQDPRSLTIKVEPETPVSGNDLMSLAKTQPGEIPDRLKASVKANEAE